MALVASPVARNSGFLISDFPVHSASFSAVDFKDEVLRVYSCDSDLYLWLDGWCFCPV